MPSEFYELLGVEASSSAARIKSAYGQALSRLARRRRALLEQGGDTGQLDLQRAHLDEAWEVLSDPLRRRRYDAMLSWAEAEFRETGAEAVWRQVNDALVHPAAAVAAKLLRVTSRLPEIGVLPLAPSGAAVDPATLIPHDDDLTIPRGIHSVSLSEVGGSDPGRHDWPEPDGLGSEGSSDGDIVSEPLSWPVAHDTPTGPPPRTADPSGPGPSLFQADTWLEPSQGEPAPPEHKQPAGRYTDPRVIEFTPAGSDTSPLKVVDGAPGSSDVLVLPSRGPGVEIPDPLPADEVALLVEEHGYSGALLREVRQRMGLSLRQVADHTRISERYLEAVEDEIPADLPAPTFIRGYVREVSRMLHLDANAVVAGYMQRSVG